MDSASAAAPGKGSPAVPGAVIFDKDGTLVDFHSTWGVALGAAIEASARSPEDAVHAIRLLEYDPSTQRVASSSPFVAESSATVGRILDPHLDLRLFAETLRADSMERVRPASGADDLLRALAMLGVPCAVATNDDHRTAELQLAALGWTSRFDGVFGADSGFGAKPDPGMVLAACRRFDAAPATCWMIGDSLLDMMAGRNAGCATLLVTNGESLPDAAIELADLVVDSLADVDPTHLQPRRAPR